MIELYTKTLDEIINNFIDKLNKIWVYGLRLNKRNLIKIWKGSTKINRHGKQLKKNKDFVWKIIKIKRWNKKKSLKWNVYFVSFWEV